MMKPIKMAWVFFCNCPSGIEKEVEDSRTSSLFSPIQAGITKCHRLSSLLTTEIFPHSSGGENIQDQCARRFWQISCLVKAPASSFTDSLLFAMSSHGRRDWELSEVFFIRVRIQSQRPHPHDLIYPLIPSHWELGPQRMNLGETQAFSPSHSSSSTSLVRPPIKSESRSSAKLIAPVCTGSMVPLR